jgi:N-acetylmuramoyl-L-alanine amidase
MKLKTDQTIRNGPQVSYSIILGWTMNRGVEVSRAEEMSHAFCVFGMLTKIGNVIPYAQCIKETGNWGSDRWNESNNPGGIGATNDGAWGNIFVNPTTGIYALYCHLSAYSLDNPEKESLETGISKTSPRYKKLVEKHWIGVAKRWIDLNGKWAYPGETYGQSIITISNQLIQSIHDSEITFLR